MSFNNVSNKQLIVLARPSSVPSIGNDNFGSGIAILSNSSRIKSLAFCIATPLIFLVIPVNFLLILSAVFLTSKATSKTSPVVLSINSPTGFVSMLRANFINSVIAPSTFVDVSDPTTPLPI